MASIDDSTLNTLVNQVWPGLESRYALPSDILYSLAYWETRGSFDDRVSPAGARGILQLTPIAIEQVRRDAGFVADPSDPYQASYAAAILLSRYFKRFKGNTILTVAAYNAGETRIARFVREALANGRATLPNETLQYIAALRNLMSL